MELPATRGDGESWGFESGVVLVKNGMRRAGGGWRKDETQRRGERSRLIATESTLRSSRKGTEELPLRTGISHYSNSGVDLWLVEDPSVVGGEAPYQQIV